MADGVSMIESELDGSRCQVAFFETWSTYAHPVTPQKPLTLRQALMRDKYHRAWQCEVNGEPLFVLFEAVENSVQNKPGASRQPAGPEPTLQFFSASDRMSATPGNGTPAPLAPGQALRQASFGVQGLDDTSVIHWFDQKVNLSYRYRYKPDGRLDTATIVNPEGRKQVLQY